MDAVSAARDLGWLVPRIEKRSSCVGPLTRKGVNEIVIFYSCLGPLASTTMRPIRYGFGLAYPHPIPFFPHDLRISPGELRRPASIIRNQVPVPRPSCAVPRPPFPLDSTPIILRVVVGASRDPIPSFFSNPFKILPNHPRFYWDKPKNENIWQGKLFAG
jgi:hypothetical protein